MVCISSPCGNVMVLMFLMAVPFFVLKVWCTPEVVLGCFLHFSDPQLNSCMCVYALVHVRAPCHHCTAHTCPSYLRTHMSSSSHDGRDELPDEDDGWEIPTSDSDAGSVESSPDVPPLVSFSEGAKRMASDPSMQYTLFWRVEKLARLMNSELTPAEREGLLAHHNGVPVPVARDLKRVCQHFGRRVGANAPARRALEFFATRDRLVVGDMVLISSIEFTLCKHIMLADRVGPELLESETCFGCSCFCKTYATPLGCKHKKLKIYRDNTFLPHTLCHECSICLRCDRLLGFT